MYSGLTISFSLHLFLSDFLYLEDELDVEEGLSVQAVLVNVD